MSEYAFSVQVKSREVK